MKYVSVAVLSLVIFVENSLSEAEAEAIVFEDSEELTPTSCA